MSCLKVIMRILVTAGKSVDWTTKGIVGPGKNKHVNGSAYNCCVYLDIDVAL